ncbi:hypothetical protein BJY01DRAFT_238255 [Aspergillus pseudoustus]|uniref:Uncharacterized protein n=1 Tax=Aspergillus pseudoustus TaxID=1810923 RepID=A0ABR4J8R5_9EURO
MNLLLISLFLGLISAFSATKAAENLVDEDAVFNNTVDSVLSRRSLRKRDVWFDCENTEFRPMLQQALQDAIPIIENMIDHLDLILGLYVNGNSGELKASKATREQRTFDENNAILSYNMIVSKIYFGAGNLDNIDGLQRVRSTRNTANGILFQFRAYAAGTVTPLQPNGRRDVAIYCDQAEYLSDRDHLGRTYYQGVNGRWYLSQRDGINLALGRETYWVPKVEVCSLTGVPGETRFGAVPTLPGMKAHWLPVQKDIEDTEVVVEESITFCPLHFKDWIETERTRTQNRLHWRNMHVPIGSNPTPDQQQLIEQLLGLPVMSATARIGGMKWLSNFVVQTLIHESTHAPSFLGPGVTPLSEHSFSFPSRSFTISKRSN